MRKEAFVIIDFDIVTVVVAGDNATLIPIGPSHGCPIDESNEYHKYVIN